jgi:hypothetical protein
MAHLAPIPEVPIQLPTDPELAEVDRLIELVDAMLEDSANKYTVLTRGDFQWETHC